MEVALIKQENATLLLFIRKVLEWWPHTRKVTRWDEIDRWHGS